MAKKEPKKKKITKRKQSGIQVGNKLTKEERDRWRPSVYSHYTTFYYTNW